MVKHFRNALKLIGRIDDILREIALTEHIMKLRVSRIHAQTVFIKHYAPLISAAYALKFC